MTLEEFIFEQHEAVNRFYRFWQTQQQGENREHFPAEMEPGDWDDQLRTFESSEES
ncbi:hypothetical protein [Roseibium sp. Sym1]|uniref:hypothetical protein n=1 Tax=Roseibium sp. Sym1 TaxID=3016006 RepID=UPI0022B417EE|nr:hypothetical protein [Roseibium sp. Sym1]